MSSTPLLRSLEGDLRRLERLLRRVAPPHAGASGDPVRILDLACGECHESGVLARVFGGRERAGHDGGAPVELVGVDVREPELQRARERDAVLPGGRCRYLRGDASRLGREGALRDPFDVVFLRHQNYWHAPETWKAIFHEGLERLTPGGRLILTSYFDEEHRLALRALRDLGAEVVSSALHAEARLLSAQHGKHVDRRVAVLRRPA